MNRARVFLVVAALFVIHITLFAHFRPFGVAPDVLLVAALVGALAGSEDFGARHGFICGLLVDLMAAGPFGLAAGVYGSVGYGVGIVGQTFDSQDPRVAPIATAVGSFLATVGYGLGLGVLGAEQYVEGRLFVLAGIVAGYNLLLTIPVQRLYHWAQREELTYARPRTTDSVLN